MFGGDIKKVSSVPDLVTNRQAGLIYRKPGLLTPAARAVADRLIEECTADPFN